MLNANISDARRHISSLAWYHNGTEIISGNGNKYTISSNGNTHTLRITSMVASDAGTYKVKIASIDYYGHSSADCDDMTVLPLLELFSLHAPVTFVVQEGCVPTYDPTSILSMLYISENANYLRLGPIQSNSSLSISHINHMWYRNGIQLSDGDMYNSTGSLQERLSLQIMYNNTADVTGSYMGILWTSYYDINNLCPSFYSYLSDPYDYIYRRSFYRIPFASSFWSINSKIRNTLK